MTRESRWRLDAAAGEEARGRASHGGDSAKVNPEQRACVARNLVIPARSHAGTTTRRKNTVDEAWRRMSQRPGQRRAGQRPAAGGSFAQAGLEVLRQRRLGRNRQSRRRCPIVEPMFKEYY